MNYKVINSYFSVIIQCLIYSHSGGMLSFYSDGQQRCCPFFLCP